MGGTVSKGVDVGNASHIVALSLPGAVSVGFVSSLLESYVFRPAGFALGGLKDEPGAPTVLDVKFQTWASSFLAHGTMWAMWWNCAARIGGMGWISDYQNWGQALAPRTEDVEERRKVGPYYIMYFSYVLFQCYKDMLKSAGRKGGPGQALFDLHHLLTVGLVAMSIHYGTWRGGMLTRLVHDVADIILYSAKMRQAIYETRRQDWRLMKPWFRALVYGWFATRIVLYGKLCVAFNRVYSDLKKQEKTDSELLPYRLQKVASWAMWILQVIFFKVGAWDASVKFWKTQGFIDDPFHGKTALQIP